jgi:hypothetical protein
MLGRMDVRAETEEKFQLLVTLYRTQRAQYESVDGFGQKMREMNMIGTPPNPSNPNPAATTEQRPAPTPGAQHPAPRKVQDLSGASGLVDVFGLTEDEINTMTLRELAGHYEKAKQANQQRKGAPPIPAMLTSRRQ